jgi:hypothetical protein
MPDDQVRQQLAVPEGETRAGCFVVGATPLATWISLGLSKVALELGMEFADIVPAAGPGREFACAKAVSEGGCQGRDGFSMRYERLPSAAPVGRMRQRRSVSV